MTAKTPIRTVFNESGTATGLAEYQTGEFVPVEHGGTGAVTLTSNSILLGNGTSAIQSSPIQISGSTISASDSTIITIDDGLSIIGALTVTGTITGAISGATTSGNIQVGVTGNNEIDTSSGNLTLDSAGGTIAVDDNLTVSGNTTITGNLTVNGTTTTVNSTTIEITNSFTFEGSTPDDFETTLGVIDPTADRTINLPNVSGTIITTGNISDITGLSNSQLSNPSFTIVDDSSTTSTISLGESLLLAGGTGITSVISGDSITFNIDNTVTTLEGTQTLTNKTLTSPKINEDVVVTATATELNFTDGVTSNIQTQLDASASRAFAIAQAVALG
jgi:hypothetical protein